VDYVDYAFQNGETPYYPQNPRDPVVKAADNLFAPISSLSSAETWDSANQAPWVVAICPEKQAGAVAAINDLDTAARLGALSTRDRIMEALRPFAAPSTSDCQPGWFASHFGGGQAGYEPIYFQRQNRFQFTYARESARLPDGRVDTVYSPSRIEALYVAPNGAAVSKVFSRADNDERGPNGLLFFRKGRSAGLDPSKSAKLPPEVSLETRTLYPARDAGGVIESFPSLQ
jgi:hypothetical protein